MSKNLTRQQVEKIYNIMTGRELRPSVPEAVALGFLGDRENFGWRLSFEVCRLADPARHFELQAQQAPVAQ